MSLTSCNVDPRFQDASDVTHVSVVGRASLGSNSLSPLFLRVSDVKFKDAEFGELQDEFHTFRTSQRYMTTPA
jgi:hypothetical protein